MLDSLPFLLIKISNQVSPHFCSFTIRMELPHLVFSGSHQYTFQHPQSQMKKAANQHQMPSQKKETWKNSSSSGYLPFHYFGFQNTHFSFLPSHLVLLLTLLFQSSSKKTSKWYRISNLEETWKENSSMCNKPFGQFRFKNKFRLHLMLLLIVLAFCPALSLPSNETVIKKSDYQALLAIKRALIDRRGVLMSWNDSGFRACSGGWTGIKCIGSRVIAIQLPWMGLSGQISDMIGRLEALRRISLHDNFFKGEIPSSLGLLPNLRLLSLSNNRLSGSIPLSIGNCLKLRNLDLSKNFLSGVIPDSLFNLTRLYRLNLSYNGLVGPVPMNISHAPSLVFLDLQQNNFSGSIPSSLGRLGMLEEIYLNGNNFTGGIPEEIGKLGRLRILDLSNNGISGTFSTSLCNLSTLVRLNLENNHLKSHIPETINRMQNLSVLVLRRNQFEGPIPSTLGNLPELSQLDFSENNITGSIPNSLSNLPNLESFNVSYNHLSGSVPFLLSKKFNSSSFKGNLQLCGYSASVPCPSPPPLSSSAPLSSIENTPVQKPHHGKVRTRDVILIAVALFLLFFSVLLCFIRKRSSCSQRSASKSSASARKGRKEEQVIRAEVQTGEDAGGKLVHFDGPLAFTADDLLCATAEIMGKSNYGTVYKATLEEGNQVAVKRLKEKFTKNQREFEDEVYALGKIRHENLLALRAYYLGPKGEKLLVFDYMPKGSLASFLHARGPDTVISWPVRMRISIDTTRGLCYLHTRVNMVHGNLTSGSILLNEQNNVKIADFGLSKLMANGSECDVIATAGTLGYRAPELSKLKIANTKTDVYSLGVIILELLTGKSPSDVMNGLDLPQWVASIVNEEWTNEVFDLDLTRDASPTTEDELLNTLKLALHCVDPSPEARPEIQQVLQQLEEIKAESAAESGDDGNEAPSTDH